MKKIFGILLLAIFLYFLSIFALPKVADQIGAYLWIEEWNQTFRDKKQQIEEKILWYDIFGRLNETKEKALEIKQNVSSWVIQTQQKIEEVRTWVTETRDALNQTMESIDKTLDAFDNLKSTVSWWGSVEVSWSGELQP